MPKFKIGVIKRRVIEERAEIEIWAPTIDAAAEIAAEMDEESKLVFADEDLLDTATAIGAWDRSGEWHELRLDGREEIRNL